MSTFRNDSPIKYFFGDGPDGDVRGIKFAEAMESGHLADFVQVKNFQDRMGLEDYLIHPEVLQFIHLVGLFHFKVFSSHTNHLLIPVSRLQADPTTKDFVNAVMKAPIGSPEYNFFNKYINAFTVVGGQTTTVPIDQIFEKDPTAIYLNLAKQIDNGTMEERFDMNLKELNVHSTLRGANWNRQLALSKIDTAIRPRIKNIRSVYYFSLTGEYRFLNPFEPIGSPKEPFRFNLLQFIKDHEDDMKSTDLDLHPGEKFLDFSTNEIISIDDRGNFVRDVNGKKEVIKYVQDRCATTQFKGSAGECRKFMDAIHNEKELVAYINQLDDASDSHFAVAKEELNNIHPKLAVKLLRNFGFKEKSFDFMGANKKFESVESWTKRMKELGYNMTITKETKPNLFEYLSTVVAFVNSNPAILNGRTNEQQSVDAPEGSYMKKIGIKMLPRIPLNAITNDIHSTLLKVAENTGIAHRLLGMQSAMVPNFRFRFMPGIMSGGMRGGVLNSSSTLRVLITNLIRDIEGKNKHLNDHDKKRIFQAIDDLQKSEEALSKLAAKLAEYRDWITLIPDHAVETITIDALDQQIDKYRERVAQYATTELGILQIAINLSRAL